MKTAQELYNFVVTSIFKDSRRCLDTVHDTCQYEYEDNQCLVGRCINKNLRSKEYEGDDISQSCNSTKVGELFKNVLSQSGINLDDPSVYDLLNSFQSFHDRNYAEPHMLKFDDPIDFNVSLGIIKEIGTKAGLNIDIINTCIETYKDKFDATLKEEWLEQNINIT